MSEILRDVCDLYISDQECFNKKILEVGSYNSWVRTVMIPKNPLEYIGVDIFSGMNVDVVANFEDLTSYFQPESFDLLIVNNFFGRIKDIEKSISSLKKLCKYNGEIIFNISFHRDWQENFREIWQWDESSFLHVIGDLHLEKTLFNKEKNEAIFFAKKLNNLEVPENLYQIELKPIKTEVRHEQIIENELHNKEGFFQKYEELKKLAHKFGTDKISYCKKYDFFLKEMKDREINFLELGVYRGSSLKMWHDYFLKARIIGVDINPECKKYENERIDILITDLSRIEYLKVLRKVKPDIIVDDASHMYSHQIKALFFLFDCLPSGGIYILEDLSTSFGSLKQSVYNDFSVSAYDILEDICQYFCGNGESEIVHKEYADYIKNIAAHLEMMTFIHGSCIMIKK